jgi:hypothetical protein
VEQIFDLLKAELVILFVIRSFLTEMSENYENVPAWIFFVVFSAILVTSQEGLAMSMHVNVIII